MENDERLIGFATQIVSAYVERNQVMTADLPPLLKTVHATLAALSNGHDPTAGPEVKPAVPVKKSFADAWLICLHCGKTMKTLKRHLMSEHQQHPADYKAMFGLDANYPMVTPEYARQRSAFAKQIGLGTVPVSGSRRGGRKKKK